MTEAWIAYAPPLIVHRAAYLADSKTVAAVERSLRVYPVDDVRSAVEAYAAVLGGSEFRWDHSWTIRDFLQRGLDKFVPEARPLDNFRRGPNMQYGRRAINHTDWDALSDRIEAEEAKQLASERKALASG